MAEPASGWPGALRRSCKRFAALARIRGASRHARVAAGVAVLLTLSGPVLPVAAADLSGSTDATCIGTMTLSFSPPLTPVSTATTVTMSGSAGCTGVGGGTVTWGSSSGLASVAADCAAVVVTGTGTMSLPATGQFTVSMVGAGPSAAQSWTFLDSSGMNGLVASGVFAWANPAQIESCALGGTSTMTLTGAFVVVT